MAEGSEAPAGTSEDAVASAGRVVTSGASSGGSAAGSCGEVRSPEVGRTTRVRVTAMPRSAARFSDAA